MRLTEKELLNSLAEHCLFCDPERHDQGDLVLLRSDSFYLFAALGAIEQGYIIITPYSCQSATGVTALSELSQEQADELLFLRALVSSYYRDRFGKIGMSFEHGRAGTCLPAVGGTKHCYHGHLCCFPSSFPLCESLRVRSVSHGPARAINRYFGLSDATRNGPYLYIECSHIDSSLPVDHVAREQWDARVIALHDPLAVESQLLRKSFSDLAGRPEAWDWLRHPEIDRSESLAHDFRAWLKDPQQTGRFSVDFKTVIPTLNFIQSVVCCNKAGNDYVAPGFYKTWGKKLQQGAVGRFLSRFPDNAAQAPRILDAGCGLGTYANAFAATGVDSYGADLSSGMLTLAKSEGSPNVKWVQMDIAEPCFQPRSFDGIWFSAVLVHVPRAMARKVTSGLSSLLKPGGIMYLSAQIGTGSLCRWEGRIFFYYTESELRAIFQAIGLDVLESWTGEVKEGTCGDYRIKRWRHYLLRLPENEERPEPRITTLASLGEHKIANEIQKWLKGENGYGGAPVDKGDYATFSVDEGQVVVTTTNHLPPLVLSMLGDDDPWVRGWYSMLVSLSPLASRGAKPLGMLLALEAHPESSLDDLRTFYRGALSASAQFNCPIVGSDLRAGGRFNCVSAAFGQVDRRRILSKNSAQVGQQILVIGEMGVFWAAALAKINKLAPLPGYTEALSSALRKPIPRLSEGVILASLGFVECAIDDPRGLAVSLRELAQANPSIDFHLDISEVPVHPAVAEIAKAVEFDVRRLQMAWGDWQLVCTCNQSRVTEVLSALSHLGCPVYSAGWTSEGKGQVWYHDESGTAPLLGLTAQQFSPESSVYEYAAVLRRTPLRTASDEKG